MLMPSISSESNQSAKPCAVPGRLTWNCTLPQAEACSITRIIQEQPSHCVAQKLIQLEPVFAETVDVSATCSLHVKSVVGRSPGVFAMLVVNIRGLNQRRPDGVLLRNEHTAGLQQATARINDGWNGLARRAAEHPSDQLPARRTVQEARLGMTWLDGK